MIFNMAHLQHSTKGKSVFAAIVLIELLVRVMLQIFTMNDAKASDPVILCGLPRWVDRTPGPPTIQAGLPLGNA